MRTCLSRTSGGDESDGSVDSSLMVRLLGASVASVLRANVLALHKAPIPSVVGKADVAGGEGWFGDGVRYFSRQSSLFLGIFGRNQMELVF